MPRGGKRQGIPGTNYPQRSDLASGPRKLPIQAATGQGYGVAGQQRAAQQAVPLASGPSAAPPAPPQMQGPPAGGAVQPTPLLAPTERPNEPVTAGSPSGPGPGPAPAMASSNLTNLLAQMAQSPAASDEVRSLAAYVQGQRN